MDGFSDLLTTEFFLVVGGIFVSIYTMRKILPNVFKNKWVDRFLPVLPLLLGMFAMVCIPELSDWESIGAKALHGLFCGFFAGHLHKLGKQTILKPILETLDDKKGKSDKSESSNS